MLLIYTFVAVVAAILNTIQAGANSQLNKSLKSPLLAALFLYVLSATVVLLALLVSSMISRTPWPGRTALAATPWWAWTGGLLGMTYVFSMLLFADKLGSAVFSAVTLSTGIIASVVLDHFGLVGFKEHPVNAWRIAGCVLMIAGSAIIAKF